MPASRFSCAILPAGDKAIGKGKRLFNFVVPMFPTKWLTLTTVAEYMETLRTGSFIALAVLDVRSPVDWSGEPAFNEHWCLTHHILDAHHKLNAAAKSSKPLRLLSFITVARGLSTRGDIQTGANRSC